MPVDKSVSSNATPVWIVGPDGEPVYPTGGGGTGGGGDASAANQTTEIARLTSIRDATGGAADAAYASADGSANSTVISALKGLFVRLFGLGLQADAVAGSDTAPASLIALTKRLLTYMATLATAANKPTAGVNLSGTATTASGAFTIPANANRKPGDVQGQNISTVAIGFNEFAGGTAAIGQPGTYTVPAGAAFSITTTNAVPFVAQTGSANVTVTGT